MKATYVILSLLIFGSSALCAANPQKITTFSPPYPEVWGYDLSNYPIQQEGGSSDIEAFRMPNGDIWFTAIIANEASKIEKKHILIKFFQHSVQELTLEEYYSINDKNRKHQLPKDILGDPVYFQNGSTLSSKSISSGKRCHPPDFVANYLQKSSPDGSERLYTILSASPQVSMEIMESNCDTERAPFLYQKLHFLSDNLIDLHDDTFIVFSRRGSLMLRFDAELKTKFISQHALRTSRRDYLKSNFFVLDYSVINKIGDQIFEKGVFPFQGAHDALLLYLKEQEVKNE